MKEPPPARMRGCFALAAYHGALLSALVAAFFSVVTFVPPFRGEIRALAFALGSLILLALAWRSIPPPVRWIAGAIVLIDVWVLADRRLLGGWG